MPVNGVIFCLAAVEAPMRDIEQRLVSHIRDSSTHLAAACTGCGECYRACPMVPRTSALDGAEPEAVMAGIRDILREGPGTAEAIAFAGACTRSGVCTPACPEKLDAAFLIRLASLRVRGAVGDAPRVMKKHDPAWSSRVKAFARLTMSEEEQATWL
jgi:ferredoxin